jgi:hypothetical protein
MMTPLSETPVNQAKVVLLRKALDELLVLTLRRGFHGTAGVEFCVQDGTIQHLRRRMERIEK